MNVRDHRAIEGSLALEVLDALEPGDVASLRSLMAAHGDCAGCRDLEDGFRAAAALLADSLAPVEVGPGAADRILAAAPRAGRSIPDRPSARRSHTMRRAILPAVAAALVLVLTTRAMLRPRIQPTTAAWLQRVVTFSGTGSTSVPGALAMAYTPGEQGVVVWGSDLPDPGAGKTYELWMIAGGAPTPGGCLHPTDGRVGAFVDASLDASEEMAVTVEPSSCPAAPTTAPLLTAQLS
jgi:hypothetical protein